MPRYMLDTDTVSFALRGEGNVALRIREHRPADVCISSVTLAELRYGADLKQSQRLHALISTFVREVAVAPFDQIAADRFGTVAASLARQGTPIGAYDSLIAAHALALGLVFVTNNLKHFNQVEGLHTETWL